MQLTTNASKAQTFNCRRKKKQIIALLYENTKPKCGRLNNKFLQQTVENIFNSNRKNNILVCNTVTISL